LRHVTPPGQTFIVVTIIESSLGKNEQPLRGNYVMAVKILWSNKFDQSNKIEMKQTPATTP